MQLSILQYKEILEILNKQYRIDLSGYAMFSLKRNLSNLIRNGHFLNYERFKEVLKNDPQTVDRILECVVCNYTSLFREPSLWRTLRDKILPELTQLGRIRIWMPEFSLEELYTLLIVLDDQNALDKSSITLSGINKKQFHYWRNCELPNTDLVQAESNVRRYDGGKADSLIKVNNNIINLPEKAKRIVNFSFGDTLDISPAVQPNLVLFRNQMIYHNHIRQHKVLVHIHKQLLPKGYLIIGAREQLGQFDIKNQFMAVNTEDQIYKRKL